MKFVLVALVLSAAVISSPAHALKGEISFPPAVRRAHAEALPRIMAATTACLAADLAHHQSFYARWRISPFYGDQSSFAKADRAGRRAYLARLRFSDREIDELLSALKPTSCIGLTLKCLEIGFAAGDQSAPWQKIRAFVKGNGTTGAALQEALQRLGWKTLYWNPDVSRNAAWDAEERRQYPNNPKYIWGNHEAHWRAVQQKRKYLYNRVDDTETLVNFRRQAPAALRAVPFFVGVAHAGYHVFPGAYGQVIEGHSTRQLTDAQTVESAPFNPLAEGGGPRGQYFSGLIAVPPGYIR